MVGLNLGVVSTMPPKTQDSCTTNDDNVIASVAGTARDPMKESTAPLPPRTENNYATASIISKLFFIWPYNLLKQGMASPLQESDLPRIQPPTLRETLARRTKKSRHASHERTPQLQIPSPQT
mmetsp:Transcript_62329/g.73829  ORF Transcript_62329/g.73829 Transcript_62329/m.73829 type:complete len:123 (-) Transcript_62329:2793-3161(-)